MPLSKHLLLAMLLCLSPLALLGDSASQGDAYNIRFGLVKMDENQVHSLSRETKVIPYMVGEHVLKFGYELTPVKSTKPYFVHYVLHLPSPPKKISDELATTNPGTPTTNVISPKREIPGVRFVDYLWFDEGDPLGPYSIDIFVNDALIKTISFEVKGE